MLTKELLAVTADVFTMVHDEIDRIQDDWLSRYNVESPPEYRETRHRYVGELKALWEAGDKHARGDCVSILTSIRDAFPQLVGITHFIPYDADKRRAELAREYTAGQPRQGRMREA